MKHRPYFSNTLSPTQLENLVKYASGVLGIMAGYGVTEEGAGAWRRLMSLGLVRLTLTPGDELSPGSLFPGSPRFLIWKVKIVNEWSSVFFSIPLYEETYEPPLCMFYPAIPEKDVCFVPRRGPCYLSGCNSSSLPAVIFCVCVHACVSLHCWSLESYWHEIPVCQVYRSRAAVLLWSHEGQGPSCLVVTPWATSIEP